MSCKFQNFNNGKCQEFDPDDKGNCICSDDEDPSYMCEDWEEC